MGDRSTRRDSDQALSIPPFLNGVGHVVNPPATHGRVRFQRSLA